jgi:hypothetical protein
MVWAGLGSLKPESQPLERMCAVADELVARGQTCLNLMFHSSSALPGATPYVPDARALGAFLARLEGLLRHLLGRLGAVPLLLCQVPAYLADRVSAPLQRAQ